MAPLVHRVLVLVYDDVQLLDVTGPVEVLQAANDRGARYAVTIASADGADVRTSAGLRIGVDCAFADAPSRIDTLIVPGAVTSAAHAPGDALVASVDAFARRSRRVASVCAGAFLLAAAGRLDGRSAATHWQLADELARRHPAVRVDRDAIFVRDGDTFTSAGVSAGIDLSLALVEADHGPVLAREVARYLVVFMQRPGGQAQFSTRLAAPPVDGPLRDVLDAISADPAGDHRLEALSEHAGFSPRHLARVFRRELGVTPARHVEQVRVEAAKARLQAGDTRLEHIARAVGFGTGETMRRAFARELGTTPGSYGRRFASTESALDPAAGPASAVS